MDKNWSIEKTDSRKAANEYFFLYAKIFIFVLSILLLLSIFFILVGVLNDKEALDYGIPCVILFLAISFYLLIFYLVQFFLIKKKCVNGQYVLRQQGEKSFSYKKNNEEFKRLELYKIYMLKNYYFIIDFKSKDIIIVPKYLEDMTTLISQLKVGATTKVILNKFQIIFIMVCILIFVLLSILKQLNIK